MLCRSSVSSNDVTILFIFTSYSSYCFTNPTYSRIIIKPSWSFSVITRGLSSINTVWYFIVLTKNTNGNIYLLFYFCVRFHYLTKHHLENWFSPFWILTNLFIGFIDEKYEFSSQGVTSEIANWYCIIKLIVHPDPLHF